VDTCFARGRSDEVDRTERTERFTIFSQQRVRPALTGPNPLRLIHRRRSISKFATGSAEYPRVGFLLTDANG
jgi:hypothetical protein